MQGATSFIGTFRAHWPIALLGLLAAALLLTNLGGDALWEDEGDTAVLARTILREGVPVAWDGVTFLDPDYGQRVTPGLVMISHPWLQYYAAAGSFAMFGESAAAARLPFALAGLSTILIVYAMALALLRSRAVALLAAGLLTLSVQFLLFSRQARNYPFNALFTCLLIWQFLRLDSWRRSALFALTAIALFHTHPIGLVALGALGALTLVSRDFVAIRRYYWPAAVAAGAYALPWVLQSRAGHAEAATAIAGISDLWSRLLQFLIEYASVAPVVGVLLLGAALWWRRRGRLSAGERAFIIAGVAVIVAEAAAVTVTQTATDMWVLGLHHTPVLIPLTIVIVSLLAVKVAGGRRSVLVALALTLGLTRAGQLVPWVGWAEPVAQPRAGGATAHVPPHLADRVLRTTQLQFVRSLVQPNPGAISRVSAFLREHASPGDVVLTNAESQALYFHTGLPQAAKVAPSFPIYRAARAHGLPEYVFGHEGVRWIVWRRAFPAYFAEQDVAALLQRFALAGIRTELVARFPETIFENRENIHFRRYPGGVYLFPWHDAVPRVRIYRVYWPSGEERRYARANTLFAAQDYGAAIAEYERFLQAQPDHAGALSKLGVSYLLAGRGGDGIRVLRRALAVAPDDGWATLSLANALFDAREIVEAERLARRAVALRPADPMAYDALGRTLGVQGRIAEAARQFERALQIDPRFAAARDHLARMRAFAASP